MDRDRLAELFDAYLERRLTEADRAALNAALVSSPEACRAFWEYAQQHALLGELLAEARGLAIARAEAAPRAARRLAVWSAGAAAAVLAAAVAWLAIGPARPEDPEVVARLTDLRGAVHVGAPGGPAAPARPGQALRAGQEVRTGDDGFAVVAFDDSSRLELNPDTAVRMDEPAGADPEAGKRVFLVQGMVSGSVAPQPEGKPLLLRSLQAELLLPGTRFSFASVLGEARLELEEGRAVFAGHGEQPVEMSRGFYAVAGPDVPGVVAAPLPARVTREKATLPHDAGPVPALAVSPDGRTLVSSGWNGTLEFWDLTPDRPGRRASVPAGRRPLVLAWSPDGRTLAVAGDPRIKKLRQTALSLWDPAPPRERLALPFPPRRVHALAFTPDSATLALAGADKRPLRDAGAGVTLIDVAGRRPAAVLAPDRRVQCVAVAPDGRTLAAAEPDGRITLWDLPPATERLGFTAPPLPPSQARGRKKRQPLRHDVRALAFSPDGSLLATGGREGVVRLWNSATGDPVRVLTGQFAEVRALAFTPDGRSLASTHGGTVKLWDVTAGKERTTVHAHKLAATAIAFTPDGRTLATAGWDRTVKLWDVPAFDDRAPR